MNSAMCVAVTSACLLCSGCMSWTRAFCAGQPRPERSIPGIAALRIDGDSVCVSSADRRIPKLVQTGSTATPVSLDPGARFELLIFNGTAKYTLKIIDQDAAVFRVRRQQWPCVPVPPCPIITHDLIRVRPYDNPVDSADALTAKANP